LSPDDERRVIDALAARWSGLIGSRYLGDRGGTPRHLIAPPPREPGLPLGFTVHLSFGAANLTAAREQAVRYAEALSILRTEIAVGSSRLSYADAWHLAERLFCGAAGPDGETCADVRGHPGFHRADGLGGLAWGDGDPDGGHDGETGIERGSSR
jgi:hypothetical protein